MLCKQCYTNKYPYQWEFRGVSDEKMRSMWLGQEIVVAGLPPLGQQTAERMSCGITATHSEHYYGDNLR